MIKLDDNSFLVEYVSELPNYEGKRTLYLDVETKNNTADVLEPKIAGMYPFLGDRVAGFSIAFDEDPEVYYVPIRHPRGNLPVEYVIGWLESVMNSVDEWVNHNIKFDDVFLRADGVEGSCKKVDTLTMAKMHESDKMGFGLKDLCRQWLDMKMQEEIKLKAYFGKKKSKDYGSVPADVMGRYANEDVEGNRRLHQFLRRAIPVEMENITNIEHLLTPVLADMEVDGLLVNETECKTESMRSLKRMIMASQFISDATGIEFVDSNKCIYEILCVQSALPVLSTIKKRDEESGREYDTGRPTFDKDALKLYSVHPEVTKDKALVKLVKAIQVYRTESQFKSLFLDSFLKLKDAESKIHPSYNQLVRTGRMSCSRPNAQQQNKRSKSLIHPGEGYGFISCDYSQIEFRLIVHYIKDEEAIAAYTNNPDTDFHSWVAEMIGVPRKVGKTLNFAMAYGAGKPRVLSGLLGTPELIEEVGLRVNRLVEEGLVSPEDRQTVFLDLCKKRASDVYDKYHERLPGIKRFSEQAAQIARIRGYVFNGFGRRRHLPDRRHCRKAFNSVVQGFANDIMKERMVHVSPRYNQKSKSLGIVYAAAVHDELLIRAPWEVCIDPEVQSWLRRELEAPKISLRVPIRMGMGISRVSWAEAAGEDQVIEDGLVVGGPVK